MNRNTFNEYILEANFRGLFLSELGWNKPKGALRLSPFVIDNKEYSFTCVAERNGLQVIVTDVDAIPTHSLARRIDVQLRKQALDYIAIYKASDRQGHHAWIVPIRNVNKRDLVSIEYETPDKADFLIQKLDFITFDPAEITTIIDVKEGVNRAFAVNSEKITKDFYSGFKKVHAAFAKFITGIDDHVAVIENHNKQWYASVMLNRLMFCYFIQKKGFLDGNVDYLRDKLDWVRKEQGNDRFFGTFYKMFLTQLFSDGLNTPRHEREFVDKFGRIPYLNGGMFDSHQIERDYADIDIADDAFISLFTFFDKWQWHLDTRVTASGKDINPDVLGYIFEQYVNDRAQMGAYYTKEDITEYIGRNCILPFLFDEVKRTANDSGGYFAPDGFVWQTLKQSGDRYIFDAVKKGYEAYGNIPENIRRGMITGAMRHEYAELPVSELPEGHVPLAELRSDWNTRTPETWGLPNEIWRETIERLQRCGEILHKIESGEITSINDFITYNMDIRNFAHDLLARGDSRFVGRFYHTLQKVTILDPTCGSGAFLFAAMNILEPLYEICIERMQEFNRQNSNLFKAELGEITDKYRSNIQYFIFKSIILRNLYGVDIMVEATEIAKLRLFLKMVAVVDVDYRAENLGLDPLPDIDFNIRCGNTLVGYANKTQLDYDLSYTEDILQVLANQNFKQQIDEEMHKVAVAYRIFVYQQLRQEEDMTAFKQAKHDLLILLKSLNDKLNHRLYSATSPNISYEEWLKSHQPFNWFAEFYQIIEGNGGFDVIIGNPPYLEKRQIKYRVENFKTWDSGAVHSMCIERSLNLLKGSLSMIVPIALVCTQRMVIVQELLEKKHSLWYSNYAWRPAHLFDNVSRALTIFVAHKTEIKQKFSTNYIKWHSDYRNILFPCIHYIEYSNPRVSFWMPKFGNKIECSILSKILASDSTINKFLNTSSNYKVYYRTTGGVYWKTITTWSPKFLCNGVEMKSSRETSLSFSNQDTATCIAGLLSSNTFWWWYTITANLRDLNPSDIMGFRFPKIIIGDNLCSSAIDYLNDIDSNSIMQIRMQKTKGKTETQLFKIGASKHYIDVIDEIIAKAYGFSELELDYILQYDIKFRIRSDSKDSEEDE